MLRFAVAALAVSALTLGLAAAASPPEKSYPIEKPAPLLKSKSPLDPVWARQLAEATKHPAKVTVPDIKLAEPNFKTIKRLDASAKGLLLQTAPERVTGPIKYSARTPFIDDNHYLELVSVNGNVTLRPQFNWAAFSGDEVTMSNDASRPRAFLYFLAEPGRRYLLECLVAVAGTKPGTISASRYPGPTYSVNTVEQASLLFLYTGGANVEQVRVNLEGDRWWFLNGCELSWTGP